MSANRFLLKVHRISAWMLLILMVVFIVSGYAWNDRIIMPVSQARYIHTSLDVILIFLFLVHALLSAKFTLKRWRVPHERAANILLLLVGGIALLLVLDVNH
jgi:hypothetical protein